MRSNGFRHTHQRTQARRSARAACPDRPARALGPTVPFRTVRVAAALLLGASALTACGAGGGEREGADGKLRLVVNGQPPRTQQFERKVYDEDVKAFEKANPDIDLVTHEGFMDPKTFNSKLAGGQLEDVFYVYFTDPATLIEKHQAADITGQVGKMPYRADIRPELLKVFQDKAGRQYGLPTANYSMGLVYSRVLFERAGLDPGKPPKTWPQVRADAKKIAALGRGTVGYADLSKNNQGGWHFAAEIDSRGGRVAAEHGGRWRAAFNNAKGRAVLRTLRDMRFKDGSMGSKQLLEAEDAQRMLGSGKLGMFLAAPDNIDVVVKEFNGAYKNYGLAPVPDAKGTLLGGEGYMVNPKASAAKKQAAVKWLQWKYLDPGTTERHIKSYVAAKYPVGLPMPPTPENWRGATRARIEKDKRAHANVPVSNYRSFTGTSVPGRVEPPQAQQVYAILDSAVQAVLTQRDADPEALLDTAQRKVDQLYSRTR